MSKFGTLAEYPEPSLASAKGALLTAWRSLERYHGEIVLVGGLAVHCLTKRSSRRPDAVTMDVDFGIALGASGGQYGTITSDLGGIGFYSEGGRLAQKFRSMVLYIDFLTEYPPAHTGSRRVDDVSANLVPGVNRALKCHRIIDVEGIDLYGTRQTCKVSVADIGPLLVLKLNAFGGPTGRRHPKDAYDILLAVTEFVDGPDRAVEAFRAEAAAGNSGYASAEAALRQYFQSPDQDGPARAVEFVRQFVSDSEQLRQDVVTVGKSLLGE